jgi:putative NADPH-quinone reductase
MRLREEMEKVHRRPVYCDLYARRFNAVVSVEEFSAYESSALPDDINRYAEELKQASMLLFVFPVWMYGLPAILKGYFDRVWRPGVSFTRTGSQIEPTLEKVQAVITISTHGMSLFRANESGDTSALFFRNSLPTILPNLKICEQFHIYDTDVKSRLQLSAELENVVTLTMRIVELV